MFGPEDEVFGSNFQDGWWLKRGGDCEQGQLRGEQCPVLSFLVLSVQVLKPPLEIHGLGKVIKRNRMSQLHFQSCHPGSSGVLGTRGQFLAPSIMAGEPYPFCAPNHLAISILHGWPFAHQTLNTHLQGKSGS